MDVQMIYQRRHDSTRAFLVPLVAIIPKTLTYLPTMTTEIVSTAIAG
jgi:hypothetical protein